MSGTNQLVQAIIEGTKEIFSQIEIELENGLPETVPSGSVSGQVTSLLTYRESISGSFVFKCSQDFASLVCMKMIGMDGRDGDGELMKDAIAETLNWISGAIKRHYVEGTKIIISTPMVFLMEESFDEGVGEDEVTVIRFFHEDHEFTMEIMED